MSILNSLVLLYIFLVDFLNNAFYVIAFFKDGIVFNRQGETAFENLLIQFDLQIVIDWLFIELFHLDIFGKR